MAEKLVKLTLQFVLTDESGPSYDNTTQWADLPYSVAITVAERLLGLLTDLVEETKVGEAANAVVKA